MVTVKSYCHLAPLSAILAILSLLPCAHGHGYLKTPRSRNYVAHQDGVWWPLTDDSPQPESEPQSANTGGTKAQCGIIAGTRNYDFPKTALENPMPPKPQQCYQPGQIIDLEVTLTAHHKGHFEFKACPISPGQAPTQACFDAHPLRFVSDVLSPGESRATANFDPNYPERAYIPLTDWDLQYKYQLPAGLSGDLVLLQWHYITANSCKHVGYDTYNWPPGFYPGDVPVCGPLPPDGYGVPEQFWNCAEVRISNNCGTPPTGSTIAPPTTTTTRATTVTTQNPNPTCPAATAVCGPMTTCPNGMCCSQWGYCGTTADYCGSCCQNGPCSNNPMTTTTTTTATTAITTTKNPSCPAATAVCGPTTSCPNGMCCSQWGYCGTTSDYCGACCQNGPCTSGPVPTPPTINPPTNNGGNYNANHGEDSRLIAYVGNWEACPTAEQVDAYSHIIVGFAGTYTWADPKVFCDAQCNVGSTVPVCANAVNQGLVDQWRAAGKKVILSFGGASMGGSWSGDQNNCWDYCFGKEEALSTSLVNIVNYQKFDGVDIDYEYCYDIAGKQSGRCQQRDSSLYSDAKAQTFLNTLTSKLRTKLNALQASNGYNRGRYIVSHAPMDSDLTPNTSAYFQVLKARNADLDFLMPQFYNGVTRPALDGIAGTGSGAVSAASIFSSLANDIFPAQPNKVVFGHCILGCGSSDVNAAQAAKITADIKAYNNGAFACNGGAFFWVSYNDFGGAWSDAVLGEVRKTAGCSSSLAQPTPKPIQSTPKPTIKPTAAVNPGTATPTTRKPTVKPGTTAKPSTKAPTGKPIAAGSGGFANSAPVAICDYSTATAGSSPSSKCVGATMNSWSSFSTFGNQNGYFAFTPTAADASAYLLFGSCYDGRGINSIAVDLFVGTATTLKVDVGVASACNGKTGSAFSNTISISATGGWQTIEIPMSFFNNQDLSKLYTIGFTGGVGQEIRVRSIKFTRKAFISRSRHELFEWENGTRRLFRFSSFNAADLIGRADAGPEGYLDPYEQEDQIITAKQMGGRVVRTYTLRVKKPGENAPSSAIQGNGVYGNQFVHLDRALQYANKHKIRLIIPFIDNWEWFGGIDSFNALYGVSNNHDAFFSDANLRSKFKQVITDVIWRVNSLTGVRYRDDPAILAWQLGNELCSSNNRNDPPVAWTQEMVDHVRSQDPNHLIMDGTWSNSANNGGDWNAGLKSVAQLDILSAHYYGGESSSDANLYANRLFNNQFIAQNAGKVFMLDEFGIASPTILNGVFDAMKTSGWTMGSLLWSIRAQSVNGGALVHYEYANFMAYHWPGFVNGPKCGLTVTGDGTKNLFDPNNLAVMSKLSESALAIAGPQNQAPPCSHRGAILQLAYNANANVPSINADNGCIQTLSHTGFSTSYRTVDLRIRQATGSFSNAIQYSFDGVKFKTLGWVDMTVKEGKFLASHRVPVVTTGGTTRTIHYQVIGRLANSSYLNPTPILSVAVAGVDPAFFNAWVGAAADTFSPMVACY